MSTFLESIIGRSFCFFEISKCSSGEKNLVDFLEKKSSASY